MPTPSIEERRARIAEVLSEHGIDPKTDVIISNSPEIQQIKAALEEEPDPGDPGQDIRRFLIPNDLSGDMAGVWQEIPPHTELPSHEHNEIVWHVVVSGTLWVWTDSSTKPPESERREVPAGEWFWVPAGRTYGFETLDDEVAKLYFHIPVS